MLSITGWQRSAAKLPVCIRASVRSLGCSYEYIADLFENLLVIRPSANRDLQFSRIVFHVAIVVAEI